ncbi:MAG: ComF family protein [Enterococcus sp.]|nr:ComF family protein [Enterococcus sp.]
MPLEKSNTATPFCKVCFKETNIDDTYSLFEDSPICASCFHEMSPKVVVSKIDDAKVTSLLTYNEKVRTMLYQCKGCFDIEMAYLFLDRFKDRLKRKYKDWVLVPAPSFEDKNIKRGFNHVEEIFSHLERPYLHPIKKRHNVKQADLNFEERQRIGEHLFWDEKVSVKGLNILFVDDLLTTGATARACIKMIKEHGAKRVEVLVMARTIAPNKRNRFCGFFSKKLQQITHKIEKIKRKIYFKK